MEETHSRSIQPSVIYDVNANIVTDNSARKLIGQILLPFKQILMERNFMLIGYQKEFQ